MTLTERAPPRVLAGDAHRRALQEQRTERHGLGERPVDVPGRERVRARVTRIRPAGMDVERVRPGGQRLDDPLQDGWLHRGVRLLGRPAGSGSGSSRIGAPSSRPVSCGSWVSSKRPVELGPKIGGRRGCTRPRLGHRARQLVGVPLAHRRVVVDQGVHAGLGERRARRPRCGRTGGSRPGRRRRPCGTSGGTRTPSGSPGRTPSGSSPLTWKIGACTILATSVAYTPERPDSGDVVNPSWLLTTTWTVPAHVVALDLGQVQRSRPPRP